MAVFEIDEEHYHGDDLAADARFFSGSPGGLSREMTLRHQAPSTETFCVIEDRERRASLLFSGPRQIIEARCEAEIPDAFAQLEAASRAGFYLAGYVTYECGYAFEPSLSHFLASAPHVPLLLFGVFDAPRTTVLTSSSAASVSRLRPSWSFADYEAHFARCQEYIYAGDVYQINLTFPLYGEAHGDALTIYSNLRARQPVELGGVVSLNDTTILSLSPELFFEIRGKNIFARPMKGTAARGISPERDRIAIETLAASEKNRAENLMIVDLLRNDLSRLSEVGSVTTSALFAIETYPTLHQMTSSVRAQLRPGLTYRDIFAGLFPCGSVTGAPKIRAMQIIAELEDVARDVYCGAIGYISPNGDMRFNVAIRTARIGPHGHLVCPVGSAVVVDSVAADEYAECLLKARFLSSAPIFP